MSPLPNGPKAFDFPDQTVDFAQEILNTPGPELASRVKKLSPDMLTTILIEIVRRYQDIAAEKVHHDEELRNLRYHADRLEKIVTDLAKRGDAGKGR